ncbi:MAG TPA: O-antigen ligase family protein [Thermoanaerobaculia bacterium]|nr:O-antigen ligase family protein [Thermoanaerobaculia bacterium]
MPKRRRRRPKSPPGVAARTTSQDAPPLASLAGVLLGLTMFLALVVVDVRAEDSFEAPKRLIAMLGVAATMLAAALGGLVPFRRPDDRRQLWALGCAAAVLALALLSTTLAPRPAIAWDTLRTLAVFAVVPLLTAAPRLSALLWRSLRRGFVAGALANAGLALLQWFRVASPFDYVSIGGRGWSSAWMGNTGLLGLVLAFATLLLLPGLLRAGRPVGGRLVTAVPIALLVAGLVLSRSVTGLAVLAAGAVVVVLALLPTRRSRRLVAAGAMLAGLGLVAAVLATSRPTRTMNQLLTFRLGPWAAAAEMAAARPLLGWGPGSYAAEYVPHVMAAEVRWQTRLANPALQGSYAEAHNDFLQATAELGPPSAILLLLVIPGLVVWPLARRPEADPERAAVLATLVAGAVASLAWFPLYRPATALLLLAALGRGWRLAAGGDEAPEASPAWGGRWPAVALALAVVLAVLPEWNRHAGERRLAQLNVSIQLVAQRPAGTVSRVAGLRRIAAEAAALDTHPGDVRPANTAGTATMLAGDPRRAAEIFAAALATGERPEVVANLGLARAASGDRERGTEAMLRAGWISPRMVPPLAESSGIALGRHIRRLEQRLAAGELRLDELPPAPEAATP